MELNYLSTLPQGGFNFDMCIRNKALAESSAMSTPVKTMKTGTTICGVIFKVRRFETYKLSHFSITSQVINQKMCVGRCRAGC